MNEEIKKIYTQVCINQNLPTTIEHNNAYMLDRFADEFASMIIANERKSWGESIVTQPNYIAEQEKITKEMRDRLEQEPVAWMYEDMQGYIGIMRQKEKPIVARPVTPLYTHSQRTWVGLTRNEVLGIEEITKHPLDFYRAIEAKLKEKNT